MLRLLINKISLTLVLITIQPKKKVKDFLITNSFIENVIFSESFYAVILD